MAANLSLPIIDLSSPDRFSTAKKIRQACEEYSCFYVVNHGMEKEWIQQLFEESKNLFTLPLEEKMKCSRILNGQTGYTPFLAERLDPTLRHKGDPKEFFVIGPSDDVVTVSPNIWPSEEVLPNWRPNMETICQKLYDAGQKVLSLLALSMNLDEDSYNRIEAISKPIPFLRLLRYPGNMTKDEIYGSFPHSDPSTISLVVTDGTPGLQICRDKFKEPHVYEDVPHVEGAFYVNIGDMLERMTNRVYQATLHRVVPPVKERYSAVYFLEPHPEYLVECMESFCSEEAPPRYAPVTLVNYRRDYFKARGY